jgi:hypothetical protein
LRRNSHPTTADSRRCSPTLAMWCSSRSDYAMICASQTCSSLHARDLNI